MADGTTQAWAGEAAPDLDLANAIWQTSSQGRTSGVQVAFVEGFVAMRSGGNPDGPKLIFPPGEWRAFVLGAREGEFDLT
ncbi:MULTISPECIES: DUF397 domain-containing protein [Streptomyces]|uniref:DUF397 domain-containing protein n=1 Tax=Streptomyces TaxID=1883 RepID=UPI0019CB3066|nr:MULTISPECIES: DUF397 domain-containing protein [Streptomyces]MCC2276005.1 DUF397 domain-containing protein [Streptomyces sp. ET3-23]GHF04949.1 hypothetical protein GCM10010359_02380 [Streptomyces morookaense]